ncbi:MAG TPA: hypothetical protein VMS08_02415 [Candidatus Saccharimonadia bacterium]|nr:hypothetical protein [Candidatus Saccharimonadia bacterium]
MSFWDPAGSKAPDPGWIADSDAVASIKTGTGSKEGETLITDGDHTDDKEYFDQHHDHYGSDFAAERGNFTESPDFDTRHDDT